MREVASFLKSSHVIRLQETCQDMFMFLNPKSWKMLTIRQGLRLLVPRSSSSLMSSSIQLGFL